MEKSQQTHRNAKETTISNYMPIKWTIWKKWIIFYNLIIYIYIYIYTYILAMQVFLQLWQVGYFPVVVHGFLIVVASIVAEREHQVMQVQQLQNMGWVDVAPRLKSTHSVVVEHGFNCTAACGVFPDQKVNPCFLHWQMVSLSLIHQGSPNSLIIEW